MIAFLGSLETFDEANSRIDRTINSPSSLFGGVLEAQFNRIDLQLSCDFINDLFASKRRLSRTGSAVRLNFRFVAADVIAFDLGVRKIVAAEHAHGARPDHTAGKSAAVVGHPRLTGHERA